MLSPGTHTSSSLVTILPENLKEKSIKYISLKNQQNRKRLQEIIQFTQNSINLITSKSNKLCKEIIEENKNLSLILDSLNKNRMISKEFLKEVENKSLNEVNFDYDYDLIFKQINKAFETQEFDRDDEYALAFRPLPNYNIELIDLKNNSISTFNSQDNYSSHLCGCCKISRSTYFINGGYSESTLYPARIIDLDSKTSKTLSNNILTCSNGLCIVDKEIFSFGGMNKTKLLRDCFKFSLDTKEWIKLQPLPEADYSTTASFIHDKILVIGYQSSSLL